MPVQQQAARTPGKQGVRGPAAVQASLIAAASDLFVAHGATAVSVREIADAAGVNHGLVHHYFHSKHGLVEAVLDDLAGQAATALESGVDLAPDGPLARYVVVASRILLDGGDPAALEPEVTATLVRRLAEIDPGDGHGRAPRPSRAARMRHARRMATMIGWLLFEPVITGAAGLADEDRRLLRRHLLDPGED